MSLTNPNTVVTEQRLNEFYKGILPYLGGMPEMLANKFSKGDLYSTDEKMIGQWIDGKPIYQKVVQTTIPSVGGDSTVSITSLSAENIILVRGIESNFDTAPAFNQYMSGGESGGFGSRIQVFTTTSTLYVRNIGYTNSVGHAIYVILQYTKTTDSAISIGDDIDYSTEEKIVGTWIDSKPIYQRTWTGTITSNVSGFVELIPNFKTITNFESIVRLDGIVKNETDSWQHDYYSTERDSFRVLYRENQLQVYMGTSYPSKPITWYVTCQYTKATT